MLSTTLRQVAKRTVFQPRLFFHNSVVFAKDALPYHLVVGLPALSPTMERGTLGEWYVKEGDRFSAGDGLAKIETDKAAMDFEAQDDGYVAKILVSAGQGTDLPIGTPIMVTVEDENDVAAFADYKIPDQVSDTTASPPPPPKVETIAPPTVTASSSPQATAVPPKQSTPAPQTMATPPPVVSAVTEKPTVAIPTSSTTWSLPAVDTSPLTKTMAKAQIAFIEKYGTTGQKPISQLSKE